MSEKNDYYGTIKDLKGQITKKLKENDINDDKIQQYYNRVLDAMAYAELGVTEKNGNEEVTKTDFDMFNEYISDNKIPNIDISTMEEIMDRVKEIGTTYNRPVSVILKDLYELMMNPNIEPPQEYDRDALILALASLTRTTYGEPYKNLNDLFNNGKPYTRS